MVQPDKHAREDEERVGELDDGEPTQVTGVDEVGCDANQGEEEWEAVEEPEEGLDDDDGVY